MNRKEFNRWYKDFCEAFPQTEDFLAKSENKSGTLAKWEQVLADVEMQDALQATALILRGDEPDLPAFERHAIPRHVAGICAKLARERRPVPSEPDLLRLPAREKNPDWSAAGICKQLWDAGQAGEDVAALAKRLMPIDREKEPTFKCLVCRDHGLVRVWHPDSMRAAAEGRLLAGKKCYSAFVRCSCLSGERYANINRGKWLKKTGDFEFPAQPYDPRRHCRCHGYSQEDVDGLSEFMSVLQPANYEPAFDSWNNT